MSTIPEDLKEAIEKYLKDHSRAAHSENTLRSYKNVLYVFARNIDAQSLDEINRDTVRKFIDSYFVPTQTTTIRYYMFTLKSFFKHIHREDIMNDMMIPREVIKKIRPLKKEEITVLLKEQDSFGKALLTFMVSSGLRNREVRNLLVVDLDFEKRRGKVLGKGQREEEEEQIFGFSKQARDYLLEYLGNRIKRKYSHVFLDKNGKQFSELKLWKYCRKNFGCHPHALRHTFCTLLAQKLPPTDVQIAARHKTFKTTQRYIHPDRDRALKALDENPIEF